MSNSEASRPEKLDRRSFLQLSALGAAGSTLTGACTTAAPAASPSPVEGQVSPAATDLTPEQILQEEDTWNEPWVWRPGNWPGQQLDLNVVENQSPGPIIGFGNPNAQLFSYGGQTPGPTIRMRGDETLSVKLRNMLGLDQGRTAIGPNPDPNELVPGLQASDIPNDVRDDFCLGEHTNGIHASHVTNLHTHGLHVRPYRNPDGTHSDNVILRVLPQADFNRRETAADSPSCAFLREDDQIYFLRDDEQVGEADYEFRIGNVQAAMRERENAQRAQNGLPPLPPQPHPPGTHWYHPHSHGATHNQVSSGMAGFLIVEGNVDEALNRRLTGTPNSDPALKTGPYDYRERLMLMQRVFVAPTDPDASTKELKKDKIPAPLVNGNVDPAILSMRPGAVERWRILNGSVDGRGFKRFMVLKGLYCLDAQNKLVKYSAQDQACVNVTLSTIEQDKQHLYLLAIDGVTLVTPDGDYTLKDLATQNAGTQNPLVGPDQTNQDLLDNYQRVFENGDTIKDCWVRPNEVYMGPANRADVFFQAPALPSGSDGEVYTVVAKDVVVHADNYQQGLQKNIAQSGPLVPGPQDIILGYLTVKGDPVEGDPLDVMSLQEVLPEAPPYLQPITDDELQVSSGGPFRTRTVVYSGWGSQDYPLVTTAPSDPSSANFEQFIAAHPELRNLFYATHDSVEVLMPANLRSMAINGRKFNPTDPERARMLVDSAEEWVLYNDSVMLWGNTDTTQHPQPGQYNGHYVSYPIPRAAGQQHFQTDPQFQITTKGVDHPFHMHQNPFWVTRIEIPDENGELHNILDEPRWMDAIWIPRHRGRVVFRARFPDFVGTYVHHCHILLHEDNGMMTPVEVTPFADEANFEPRAQVVSTDTPVEEVNQIYPPPTPEEAYQMSSRFVDPNMSTGQTYPGFEVIPPTLPA